jgi:hypothetical protein
LTTVHNILIKERQENKCPTDLTKECRVSLVVEPNEHKTEASENKALSITSQGKREELTEEHYLMRSFKISTLDVI